MLLRTAYLTLSQISQIRNLSLFPPRQSLLLPTYCLYLKHSERLTKRKHSMKRNVKVKHISPCYKWNVILSFFGRSADAGKKIRPCQSRRGKDFLFDIGGIKSVCVGVKKVFVEI